MEQYVIFASSVEQNPGNYFSEYDTMIMSGLRFDRKGEFGVYTPGYYECQDKAQCMGRTVSHAISSVGQFSST